MSQADLAAATGVGQAQISKIENGALNAMLSTCLLLAAALGQRITLAPEDET